MATYSLAAAQTALEELIDRAEAVEDIMVLTSEGRRVQIVPLTPDEKTRLENEPIE
ncbi:hypothetical protein [Hansschlegelia zhihuaiae]|uniref:hypothetical protein n=1 Tax=Hansschlegelia zhihuaiae TaxID=405005 RepID=UPI0013E8BC86|nr:hypothetical protein [Hansschlegelia zhihuaiae]